VAHPVIEIGPSSSVTLRLPPSLKVGVSLIGVIVIVVVWAAEVLRPPPSVSPSSAAMTVMVVVPLASGAGVKVKVPVVSMAGSVVNMLGWSTVTVKPTFCADSFQGPREISLAHPLIEIGPLSSASATAPSSTNRGGSLRAAMLMVTIAVSQALVVSHNW
jgi:hypothetical protein